MEGARVPRLFFLVWDVKVDQILKPSQFILLFLMLPRYTVLSRPFHSLPNVIAALYTSSVIWLATFIFHPWDPTCLIRDKNLCPEPTSTDVSLTFTRLSRYLSALSCLDIQSEPGYDTMAGIWETISFSVSSVGSYKTNMQNDPSLAWLQDKQYYQD